MSSLSATRLKNNLILSSVIFAVSFVLKSSPVLMYRFIDSFFLGGIVPLIVGGFRFVKYLGSFDLLVYSHRKLWKYGKAHEKFEEENEKIAPGTTEKLGTYADYLEQKNAAATFKEPLLVGGAFFLVSLALTLAVF